jgi:hypothetical protein
MKRLFITAVFGAFGSVLMIDVVVHAADQGVTGKKLLLKDSGKFVLLSKDPAISIAGSEAIQSSDSTLTFDDGSGPVTLTLPVSHWSTNSATTILKFKNPGAPVGSIVKIVKIKSGLLKAVSKGLPFPVPNGAATIDVVLSLNGGTNRYCMTFAGTGDGAKFFVKDASAGTCPSPASCGNDVQESGETCDGSDAPACPGDCLNDCTCAPACATSGANAAACNAYANAPSCTSCCAGDPACSNYCQAAMIFGSCGGSFANSECANAANAAGCAAECCPPPPPPACGNNTVEGTEICDGTDATACPGVCQSDCTCPPQTCGNDTREGTEACDGSDATACPNDCLADCTCAPVCPASGGDNTACLAAATIPACTTCCSTSLGCSDGCGVAVTSWLCTNPAENDTCAAAINANGCADECCSPSAPVCSNDTVEGTEECDGTDDSACPSSCQSDCTCSLPAVCGNNVREGAEACDGTDAASCPGACNPDCTCGLTCPLADPPVNGLPTACNAYGNNSTCAACCALDSKLHLLL